MSEIEDTQQAADMLRLEYEVEQALQDAEDGLILTFDQIDTLRYACGLPKKDRQRDFLKAVFTDLNPYGGVKWIT